MKSYPNFVGILLGALAMLFHAVVTVERRINETGRFDIFTEVYIRCFKKKDFYLSLKADVIKAYETGRPVPLPDSIQPEFTKKVLSTQVLSTHHDDKDPEGTASYDHLGETGCSSASVARHFKIGKPFEWMETVSLQGKTNFFETRVGEYSKSGVGIDRTDQSFALDASF